MESTLLALDGGSIRPRVLVAPLGLWVVMAALAVVNAVFREFVLVPRLEEYPGHVVSTVLLAGMILLVSYLYFANSTTAFARAELLLIGAIWVVLTVGFEFVVGYFEGTPVSTTIAQYDVLSGQVWIIVPITLFLAPLIFGWYLGR